MARQKGAGHESPEVEFVVDQVIEREFKAAGLDLLAQHHRQEPGIAVDLFVSRYVLLSCIERFDIDSLACSLFQVGGCFCTASTWS